MNIKEALKIVRDVTAPHDEFIFAIEYIQMYREGECVVHYCSILGDYVYIELDGITLFYLDMLFAV